MQTAATAIPPQALYSVSDDPFERTKETLKKMRDAVEDSRIDPVARDCALKIVCHVPSKSWRGEAQAVFDWVRENIRYVRDPRGIELINSPERILRDRAGDCDDHAVLVASLLDAIGATMRFKAISFSRGAFVHVYAQVHIGCTLLALDTTEDKPLGWQPPNIYDRMIMRIPPGDRGARRRLYRSQYWLPYSDAA